MIYAVVRATTDWLDESVYRAQIPPAFAGAIARWDATFDMPYNRFRHELKRIAQLSLSRLDGVTCVTAAQVPEGALVLPTDDDDWFAPHLAQVLARHLRDGRRGYYWQSRFLEVPLSLPHRVALRWRRVFPNSKPRWLCTTNNYAVVADRETLPLLRSHIDASRWFIAHASSVQRVDAALSLQNRNLASQTTLNSVPTSPALKRRFRQYQSFYRQPVAEDLAWAAPYIAMMGDLMDGLNLRRDA
jgi:hypothetical protein